MLKAVDFFCGGGGMSYGIQQAGIKILAGIDCEPSCKETYEANISETQFIQADVFHLDAQDIEAKLNLSKNDDGLILIGCNPCQFWSIINTDKSKAAASKSLLIEFERFVKYFNPGYVIVENVPGVLRKKEESGLENFIIWLQNNQYTVHFAIHDMSNYGVPQSRKRFTLIANRISTEKVVPLKKQDKKLVVRDIIGVENGFPPIRAGHIDNTPFLHSVPSLSEINQERLTYVPKDGGNRLSFAHIPHLQLKCFIGKENSFKDTFGRLWWDRPSPTITTKFFSISNGRFVHPEEDRGLSIREGAVLQSFPKNYQFFGTSIASIARLIGNAVPPLYAQCIGEAIINNYKHAIQNKSTSC